MKARPTIYNGIQMRSRLEAGFASWLDSWKFDWEYEPHALASEGGQYLPDFLLKSVPTFGILSGDPQRDIYVEVKPSTVWDGLVERPTGVMAKVCAQAEIVRESRPGSLFMLATPGGPWGDDPRIVTLVTRLHDRDGAWPLPWFQWLPVVSGGLVLGAWLNDGDLPWPDGYWKADLS